MQGKIRLAGARCGQQAKYVECVVPWMVRQFIEAGAQLREIEVKVFGGADMFNSTGKGGASISIGKQNKYNS